MPRGSQSFRNPGQGWAGAAVRKAGCAGVAFAGQAVAAVVAAVIVVTGGAAKQAPPPWQVPMAPQVEGVKPSILQPIRHELLQVQISSQVMMIAWQGIATAKRSSTAIQRVLFISSPFLGFNPVLDSAQESRVFQANGQDKPAISSASSHGSS